jgi:hypothetical protein
MNNSLSIADLQRVADALEGRAATLSKSRSSLVLRLRSTNGTIGTMHCFPLVVNDATGVGGGRRIARM